MKTTWTISLICLTIIFPLGVFASQKGGPQRVSTENPRYFIDGSGRAVYLTGSYTCSNLVGMGPQDPPPPFDLEAYLHWMDQYNHNFILWTWELVALDILANERHSSKSMIHHVVLLPYLPTGPGKTQDGKPKFDLASTGYCLAEKGREYLVYLPEGNEVIVDLTDVSGHLSVEWFNPNTGETTASERIRGCQEQVLSSPFGNDDVVVYLK